MAIYEDKTLVMSVNDSSEWTNGYYDRLTGEMVLPESPILEIKSPIKNDARTYWLDNYYYTINPEWDVDHGTVFANNSYSRVNNHSWSTLNINLTDIFTTEQLAYISIYPVYKSSLGRAFYGEIHGSQETGFIPYFYPILSDSQLNIQDPTGNGDENEPYTIVARIPFENIWTPYRDQLTLYMSVHEKNKADVSIKVYRNTPIKNYWRAISLNVSDISRGSISITPTYNFQTGNGPGTLFVNRNGSLTELKAPQTVMADTSNPYKMDADIPIGTKEIRISAYKNNPSDIKIYEIVRHEISDGDNLSDGIYDKSHSIQFIPESELYTTDDRWSFNQFDDGMWLNGVIYGRPNGALAGKNSWTDWHLIPEERPSVKMPPLKSNTLEIPGMDGVYDFSETVSRRPIYGNRTGSWSFIVDNYHENWSTIYSNIANYLHGKRFRVILMDDPGYFYEGRVQINEWKSDKWNSKITLNYDLGPYKKESVMSLNPWCWSPFNFETGLIRNYANIDVRNGRIASINYPSLYTSSGNYVIGDYCSYEGHCYRCIHNTSGPFDEEDWINLGKNIGLPWSIDEQYHINDYCSYPPSEQNSRLYRCIAETSGLFTPSAWTDMSGTFEIANTSEYLAFPEFDVFGAVSDTFTIGLGTGGQTPIYSFTIPGALAQEAHYKPPSNFRIHGSLRYLTFEGTARVRVFYRGGKL